MVRTTCCCPNLMMISKPPISDEDRALWKAVSESVKPLASRKNSRLNKPRRSTSTKKQLPKTLTPLSSSRRSQRRIAKHMLIEAELDLHGYTQEQAYRALTHFLETSQSQGLKCVLVITGKGMQVSQEWWEEVGVLSKALPHWLDSEPNSSKVLSYSIARQRDGGTGAYYVYLRRIK